MKHKRCEKCNKLISNNMAWTSLRMFGKELCWDDQAPYKLFKKDRPTPNQEKELEEEHYKDCTMHEYI